MLNLQNYQHMDNALLQLFCFKNNTTCTEYTYTDTQKVCPL